MTDNELREHIAQEIEKIIPDPHLDHEVCSDCWALREAANIARGNQNDPR